jgi:flagellar protein FliS
MDQKLRIFYLENQIKNASPGQLLIMLYDGLIQNAESAATELSVSDNSVARVEASRSVSRCIDIMTELNTCLRPEHDPKLCSTLTDLYTFFTREFSEAYDKVEPKRIQAILPLIRELRTAWFQADRTSNKFDVPVDAVAA